MTGCKSEDKVKWLRQWLDAGDRPEAQDPEAAGIHDWSAGGRLSYAGERACLLEFRVAGTVHAPRL